MRIVANDLKENESKGTFLTWELLNLTVAESIFPRWLRQYISHSTDLSCNVTLTFLHWEVCGGISLPSP